MPDLKPWVLTSLCGIPISFRNALPCSMESLLGSIAAGFTPDILFLCGVKKIKFYFRHLLLDHWILHIPRTSYVQDSQVPPLFSAYHLTCYLLFKVYVHILLGEYQLMKNKVIHVQMWELHCEESWMPKNWCFWTVALEKTLESPLDCKEIQPVHPKGDQSWVFIGRTDAETEPPILWPPHAKSWLTGKDPDTGRDWGQEGKRKTEDEMAGWHHRLNGHEFE